jgi:hypothetical protein
VAEEAVDAVTSELNRIDDAASVMRKETQCRPISVNTPQLAPPVSR